MTRRVLSVGQCGADHAAISRLIAGNFDATVEPADDAREALERLRAKHYDLVLVNRVFDLDGGEGLDLIRTLQADESLAGVPVMLVTNYPEHQQAAVDAGAAPGFGKRELGMPATREKLAEYLQ